MQPLLMRLKSRDPATEIHVLAPAWSAPLLERMPEVTAIIENPFPHGRFDWAGRKALGRRLASADFSTAYVLPNSWKSALVPFFAKIPERIGYTGEMRHVLLNRRFQKSVLPRLVDRYAALAGQCDTPAPEPRLSSSPAQQKAARAALDLPEDDSPIIFCPGAEYGPAKRWPLHHFAALAKKVGAGPSQADFPPVGGSEPILRARGAKNFGAGGTGVWVLGSAKDAAAGETIARLSEGAAINLCGRTTLEQAIDLIAGAQAVVTNDSGLMHVAAALGRPMVAIYGSSSPAYTPPLSAHAKVLSLHLQCSPCFRRECPLGHLHCLENLSPEQVLRALPC